MVERTATGQIGPARCSPTRTARPAPSRTCPDPARPRSATPRAPLPRIREEFPPASRGRACTPSTVRRLLRYITTPHPSGRSTPPHSLTPPLQSHREPPEGRAVPKLCRRRGSSWPQRLSAPLSPLWPVISSRCFTTLTRPFFPLDRAQERRRELAGVAAVPVRSSEARRGRCAPSQQAGLDQKLPQRRRRRFESSPSLPEPPR